MEPTGETGRGAKQSSRRAARWAFGVAVLLFAAQYPIAKLWGEPYPALFLPNFGQIPQRGNVYVTNEYRAFLQQADGTEIERPAVDLLPPTAVLATSVIRRTFFDEKTRESPETAQWLDERVESLDPGREYVGVRVEMWEVDYDLDEAAPPMEEKKAESTFTFSEAAR